MDSRSRIEAGGGEMIWYTNLRLLGLQSSKLEISNSMFDHPNPSAFQRVFYKLFEILNKEHVTKELRDCWPVLDKKQEAEFRRKVAGLVKVYQKDYPEDLPYTNPSLFQSPGGRKFVVFLNKFTSFVLKIQLSKNEMILHRPAVKRSQKQLRKRLFSNLAIKGEDSLKEAVEDQEEAQKVERKAKCTGESLMRKYGEYKKRLEALKPLEEQIEGEDSTEPDNESLREFDDKCTLVKDTFQDLLQVSSSLKKSFDVIEYVSGDSGEKVGLNLLELPSSSLSSSLSTSYQHLLTTALQCSEKVLTGKTDLPRGNWDQDNQDLRQILDSLKVVEEDLISNKRLTGAAVDKLQAVSQTIDWSSYSLSGKGKESQEILLPPTPSIVENIRGRREDPLKLRNLQLFTPELKLSTPSLRLGVGAVTPVRSGPATGLTRRFQLVAGEGSDSAFNSPHLKPKASFGEMSRLGGESNLESTTRSTASIGDFAPDLCSTAAVEKTFSELAESAKLDRTNQDKIEMYRRVLSGLKTGQEDKSVLMSAWNTVRDSLSPRSTVPRPQVSRILLDSPTSDSRREGKEDLVPSPAPLLSRETSPRNDLLMSRLDQLMTSLTLNESDGQSFLNVSQEEVELLSPNL